MFAHIWRRWWKIKTEMITNTDPITEKKIDYRRWETGGFNGGFTYKLRPIDETETDGDAGNERNSTEMREERCSRQIRVYWILIVTKAVSVRELWRERDRYLFNLKRHRIRFSEFSFCVCVCAFLIPWWYSLN